MTSSSAGKRSNPLSYKDVWVQGRRGPTMRVYHSAAGLSMERVASTDFDNDGRMDLLVVDSDGPPLLLHNETQTPAHWLGVRLVGVRSNHDAVGAMITLEAGGLKQTRRCGTDGSYLSASDPRVHFGLGNASRAASVSVRWPSGATTTLHDVEADRYVLVREPESR